MNKKIELSMKIFHNNYPICTLPLVESYLAYKNIVPNTSYVYLDYSLRYTKKDDTIFYEPKDSLHALNISLTIRENDNFRSEQDYNPDDIYLKELEKIYGVTVNPCKYFDVNEFKGEVFKKLNQFEPTIFQFNLAFIPNRMGFENLFYEHMIAIIGYDPEKKVFLCMDDYENPYFEITEKRLQDCFMYIKNKYGNVKLYDICIKDKFVEPDYIYFKKRIEEIITYNNQKDDTSFYGIDALNAFHSDFNIFLANNSNQEYFEITDIFKVYKERKTTFRCLENFKRFNNKIEDLQEIIQKEGNLWFELYFLIKRSIFEKRWSFDSDANYLLNHLKKLMPVSMNYLEQLI